jgi:hypothetical protein
MAANQLRDDKIGNDCVIDTFWACPSRGDNPCVGKELREPCGARWRHWMPKPSLSSPALVLLTRPGFSAFSSLSTPSVLRPCSLPTYLERLGTIYFRHIPYRDLTRSKYQLSWLQVRNARNRKILHITSNIRAYFDPVSVSEARPPTSKQIPPMVQSISMNSSGIHGSFYSPILKITPRCAQLNWVLSQSSSQSSPSAE